MQIPENLEVAKLFEKQIQNQLRCDALSRLSSAFRDLKEIGVNMNDINEAFLKILRELSIG